MRRVLLSPWAPLALRVLRIGLGVFGWHASARWLGFWGCLGVTATVLLVAWPGWLGARLNVPNADRVASALREYLRRQISASNELPLSVILPDAGLPGNRVAIALDAV